MGELTGKMTVSSLSLRPVVTNVSPFLCGTGVIGKLNPKCKAVQTQEIQDAFLKKISVMPHTTDGRRYEGKRTIVSES